MKDPPSPGLKSTASTSAAGTSVNITPSDVSEDDRNYHRIIVLEDFRGNAEARVATLRGQHVAISGDNVVLTGWRVLPKDKSKAEKEARHSEQISDYLPAGTRYYMSPEQIDGWEEDAEEGDGEHLQGHRVVKGGRNPVFVSNNSIWTSDPEEPILEETRTDYNKTRKLFFSLLIGTALVALLITSCMTTWAFFIDKGNITNSTYIMLASPEDENKTNLQQYCAFHALTMLIAVVINLGFSAAIYRIFPQSPMLRLKSVHASFGFSSLAGCAAGLFFVINAKKFRKVDYRFGVHDTVGYVTIGMILFQFTFGFIVFLLPFTSFSRQITFAPIHKFFGSISFILCIGSCITGFVAYAKLLIPLDLHAVVPLPSLFLHVSGLATAIFGLLAATLFTDIRFRRRARPEFHVSRKHDIREFPEPEASRSKESVRE